MDVDFDEFVRMRSSRLLRLAYLLTRNHDQAEDLLQTTLARCWGAWRRIDGDPEPYVRRSMVNTYNSWWQRRWRDELPSEHLPERPGAHPQSHVDDRDEMWQVLGLLPRQQRTVLVLRYFEDLTEAQVAEALGITVGSVKNTASKALARLRTEPMVRQIAMPDVPAGTERVAAVRQRITQRRRTRAAAVSAAIAVVLALLGGYALAHRPDRITPVHPAPSPSQVSATAFPEYYAGEHMLANKLVNMTADGVVLRYPANEARRFHFGCTAPAEQTEALVTARFFVNGVDLGETGCYRWGTAVFGSELEGIPQPATTTITVTFKVDGTSLGSGKLPRPVLVGFGASVPVPLTRYSFPPRPATLKPLPRRQVFPIPDQGDGYLMVVPDPGDSYVYASVCIYSQTPGEFHITVDGKDPLPGRHLMVWDYSMPHLCPDVPVLKPGAHVRVTAERVTGAWQADLFPEPSPTVS